MKALLTKEEIARHLSPKEPLSERSVQRCISIAGVKPEKGSKGGAGNVSKYRREDAEKIKEAYHKTTSSDEIRRIF